MSTQRVIPLQELNQLRNLLSYFISQRELKKPVDALKQTIRDIKLTTMRVIIQYYLPLQPAKESAFLRQFTRFLKDIRGEVVEEGIDPAYFDYCSEKMVSTISFATDIKRTNRRNVEDMLSEAPMLEPFDLMLKKPKLKLVKCKRNSPST